MIRHDIPTGISIEVHVRLPQCDPAADSTASSSTMPYVPRVVLPAAANSFLQGQTQLYRLHPAGPVQVLPEDGDDDTVHLSLLQLQAILGGQQKAETIDHESQLQAPLLHHTIATFVSSLSSWHQALDESFSGASVVNKDQPYEVSVQFPLTAQQNSQRSCPARVTVSLEATIPREPDAFSGKTADSTSALLWFHHESWADYCRGMPPIQLSVLPDGLQVPRATYPAFLDPGVEPPLEDYDWEFFR